jgi:hypothetical protein
MLAGPSTTLETPIAQSKTKTSDIGAELIVPDTTCDDSCFYKLTDLTALLTDVRADLKAFVLDLISRPLFLSNPARSTEGRLAIVRHDKINRPPSLEFAPQRCNLGDSLTRFGELHCKSSSWISVPPDTGDDLCSRIGTAKPWYNLAQSFTYSATSKLHEHLKPRIQLAESRSLKLPYKVAAHRLSD